MVQGIPLQSFQHLQDLCDANVHTCHLNTNYTIHVTWTQTTPYMPPEHKLQSFTYTNYDTYQMILQFVDKEINVELNVIVTILLT